MVEIKPWKLNRIEKLWGLSARELTRGESPAIIHSCCLSSLALPKVDDASVTGFTELAETGIKFSWGVPPLCFSAVLFFQATHHC